VGLLGIPLISSAQTRQDSWASLNSLRAGEKIEVIETNLTKHRGAFSTVSDEILQMREGGADVGIKKENVMRVTVLDKNHRLRNALIVGAVGEVQAQGSGRQRQDVQPRAVLIFADWVEVPWSACWEEWGSERRYRAIRQFTELNTTKRSVQLPNKDRNS
jgi:hypothetical protein